MKKVLLNGALFLLFLSINVQEVNALCTRGEAEDVVKKGSDVGLPTAAARDCVSKILSGAKKIEDNPNFICHFIINHCGSVMVAKNSKDTIAAPYQKDDAPVAMFNKYFPHSSNFAFSRGDWVNKLTPDQEAARKNNKAGLEATCRQLDQKLIAAGNVWFTASDYSDSAKIVIHSDRK
ncbi:MAG: hypothetical protein K2Q34_01170 [Alphaproteobacteria bacterium]|nr:hypothetical protein [Alphaproteobacteria bacterium]